MGSEYILFFRRGSVPKRIKRRNSIVHVPQIRPEKLIHPHEKPLQLLEMFILASTDPGDFIVDGFGGSGSLARAARNAGRSCLCMELDEYNYKLAVEAFESTGGGMF
jgi:DNA modification methylase